MALAREKAKKTTDVTERENYEAFLFREVNCLLHEIAHVFITYLSKGRPELATPTEMKGDLMYDKEPNKGEAGRKLEALAFGGTMEYMVDPDTGAGAEPEGGKPRKVSSHIIALVRGRFVGI